MNRSTSYEIGILAISATLMADLFHWITLPAPTGVFLSVLTLILVIGMVLDPYVRRDR